MHTFNGQCAFRTWLYGIARNLCLNAVRKRSDLLSEDGLLEIEGTQPGALTLMRREERIALLREAAAACLDPVEQEAIYLRYEQNLPRNQIEAVLGLEGRSGARGLLQRCLRKLKKELRRRLEARGLGSSFIRGTWG